MPSILFEVAHKMSGGGGNGPGGMAAAAPSGVSTGGGRGKNAQQQVDTLGEISKSTAAQAKGMKNQPKWWTKALKTMGVQMSLSGILKQSQIFTSVLGSLFQILGAFVDIMLAPWIPVIIPGIRKLADQVPKIRKWAQQFYDWVMNTAWPWLNKWWTIITKDLWTGAFWGKAWETLWGGLEDTLKGLWDGLMDKVAGMNFGPMFKFINESAEKLKFNVEKVGDKVVDSNECPPGTNGNGNGNGGVPFKEIALGTAATYGLTKVVQILTDKIPVKLLGKTLDLNPVRLLPGIKLLNAATRLITKPIELFGKGVIKGVNLLGRVLPSRPTTPPRGGATVAASLDHSRAAATMDDATPPRLSVRQLAVSLRQKAQAAWDKTNLPKIKAYKPPKPTAAPVVRPSSKMSKASAVLTDFRAWIGPAISRLGEAAAKGGSGLKSLVNEGWRKVSLLMAGVKGTAFATAGARLVARFVKVIPFLGAAYMGAETSFDLKQMVDSDVGWTGDLTSGSSWMKEAKGSLSSLLGQGTSGTFINPVAKLFRWGGEKLPFGVGEQIEKGNEVLERWKKEQSEGGAISGGKALDFGVRALTGYGGAAASFLPLLGQLIGGAVYEGGAAVSTGRVMGFGEGKYGKEDFASWGVEAILDIINNSTIDINVAGAPGTMQTGPGGG